MRRRVIVGGGRELAARAADLWRESARRARYERGVFAAALSGGKSPEGFFREMARLDGAGIWAATHVFQADERNVPPDHSENNWRMISSLLLEKVPVPPGNLHPVRTGDSLAAAVRGYREQIEDFFRAIPEPPRFDLVLLGIGADGHTASLFPGRPELLVADDVAAGVPLGPPKHDRVTLTLPVLNAARRVIFLASGEAKAAVLKEVLEDPACRLPAALVRPEAGEALFLLDPGAASTLSPRD